MNCELTTGKKWNWVITVEGPSIFFDVDETLVMWGMTQDPKAIPIHDGIAPIMLVPHEKHIEDLKDYSDNGYNIVVWSAGGAEWASRVVKSLKLENYVSIVVSKPTKYYDDLPGHEILTSYDRIYYEQKTDNEIS